MTPDVYTELSRAERQIYSLRSSHRRQLRAILIRLRELSIDLRSHRERDRIREALDRLILETETSMAASQRKIYAAAGRKRRTKNG